MVNGLNINVSQEEFMKKTPPEQNWMLFESVNQLNIYGCKWGREIYKKNKMSTAYMIGAGIGAVFGFTAIIWNLLR